MCVLLVLRLVLVSLSATKKPGAKRDEERGARSGNEHDAMTYINTTR